MDNSISRRSFLKLAAGGLAAAASGAALAEEVTRPQSPVVIPRQPIELLPLPGVKWLTFDIVGTVYDAYDSLAAGIKTLNAKYGLTLNPGASALNFIEQYASQVSQVNGGQMPWTAIDQILKNAVYGVFSLAGAKAPTAAQVSDFYDLWHTLNPWPDVSDGFELLHHRFSLSVLSNMSISTAQDLNTHAGLTFDRFLSSETVNAYKPNPAVYQMAVSSLGVKPSEILMVAAHKYDLDAAKAQGFHTAFVARPGELGPTQHPDTTPGPYDFNATSMIELANKLGIPSSDLSHRPRVERMR